MRAPTLLLLVLASSAGAQEPTREKLEPRRNQKIERIRVEDEGNRIDELRVGGQTQQITVQPKARGVPSYEVKPSDGRRVWNIFAF